MTVENKNWAGYGSAIHTALRKCCDSVPTTLLYNLIDMDNPEMECAWENLLKLLAYVFAEEMTDMRNEDSVADTVMRVFQCKPFDFPTELWPSRKEQHDIHTPSFVSLAYASMMIPEDEWKGVSSFLVGWEEDK